MNTKLTCHNRLSLRLTTRMKLPISCQTNTVGVFTDSLTR